MSENLPEKSLKPSPRPRSQGSSSPRFNDEQYNRLKAEAAAPYRGLRKFIYVAFAASGAIGGFVFLTQILAGQDVGEVLPNFFLQIGVVALMVWFFQLEGRAERKKKK